jgi:putative peptidoglycan lipid II flippase
MLVFAVPMTATVFGHGEFTARDVQMTSYALMAYSVALLGMSLVKVLAPGYFARQDTRTPVRVGLIALGVNIGLNLVIVLPAARLGFPAPHALLAVSTSISSVVNTALLWRGLQRSGVYLASPGWPVLLTRILAANLVMAGALWWLAGDPQAWVTASALERVGRCAVGVLGGAVVYFAALYVFGLRYRHVAPYTGRL